MFHTNLLSAHTLCTTSIICSVQIYCIVICRMQLAFVVKLCSGDKASYIFVYVNDVPQVLGQVHCIVKRDLFLSGLNVVPVLVL
jgi:hypothetical protein